MEEFFFSVSAEDQMTQADSSGSEKKQDQKNFNADALIFDLRWKRTWPNQMHSE